MASGNVAVRVGADIAEFQRKMAQVETKMKGLGKNLSAVGKKLTTRVTLPVVGMGVAMVKASSDFESAFAGVRKTVDATEAEYAKLSQGIRNMAKEIPASHEAIAGVMEAAGQLGIAQKDLMSFTRVMIDLGNTTNLSADEAATALARFANIMGTNMQDIDRLGSTIVDLGNNLATTEMEIVDMAMRLAGAGKQVGMTEAEVLSLAGALSSVGIAAEMGGSAFSRLMINMASAVETGSEEIKGYAQVAGIAAADFAKLFKEDATGAIMAFLQGLQRIDESGGSAIVALEELGITEIRLRDAILRATNASDLFGESLRIGANAWQENTALTKEAQQRYDTFASKLRVFLNTLNDVSITLGDVLLPPLTKVMEFVGRVATAFGQLSPEVQKSVLIIAGLFAASGPLMLAINGFIALVTTAFGPVGLIAAAIMGLVYVWQRWGEDIKAYVAGVVEAFRGMWQDFITVKDNIVGVVQDLFEKVTGFFDRIKESVTNTATAIKDNTIGVFGKMRDGIVEKAQDATSKVKDAFQWLGDKLVWNSIVPDLVEKMKEVFGEGFDDIVMRARVAAQKTADEIAYIAAQVEWAKRYMGQDNGPTKADEYTDIDEARRIGEEVAAGMEEAKKATDDVGKSFDDLATKSDLWTKSLADGIAEAIVEGRSLLDVLQEIGKAILKSTISRALPGLFGIGIGGWHTGGVIGQDQPTFMRGIKSYDTGGLVGAGEELAILHKGEAVFTPAQLDALGSAIGGGEQNVNITMNVNAVDARSFVDLLSRNKATVEAIVVNSIWRNDKVRKAIKGAT